MKKSALEALERVGNILTEILSKLNEAEKDKVNKRDLPNIYGWKQGIENSIDDLQELKSEYEKEERT